MAKDLNEEQRLLCDVLGWMMQLSNFPPHVKSTIESVLIWSDLPKGDREKLQGVLKSIQLHSEDIKRLTSAVKQAVDNFK